MDASYMASIERIEHSVSGKTEASSKPFDICDNKEQNKTVNENCGELIEKIQFGRNLTEDEVQRSCE